MSQTLSEIRKRLRTYNLEEIRNKLCEFIDIIEASEDHAREKLDLEKKQSEYESQIKNLELQIQGLKSTDKDKFYIELLMLKNKIIDQQDAFHSEFISFRDEYKIQFATQSTSVVMSAMFELHNDTEKALECSFADLRELPSKKSGSCLLVSNFERLEKHLTQLNSEIKLLARTSKAFETMYVPNIDLSYLIEENSRLKEKIKIEYPENFMTHIYNDDLDKEAEARYKEKQEIELEERRAKRHELSCLNKLSVNEFQKLLLESEPSNFENITIEDISKIGSKKALRSFLKKK